MDSTQLRRIYEALDHLEGEPTAQAIAQTLGVSVEEATEGLDQLCTLGLVEVANVGDLRYTARV